ncbi:hypothetical protein C8J55DRAFT_484171 [Lentinula edodes]|uniref:Uncharacterized protein n=1 Tax=Lentinula lateritia TaxID=40482 RepID=A0A9W9E259_9AGAR|nr:hypothetical protein C8J55DRAFT_484171 [Lentinula edodes]
MAENNLQITFPAPPGAPYERFGLIFTILELNRYFHRTWQSTYMLETQDVPMDIDDENGIDSKSSSDESFMNNGGGGGSGAPLSAMRRDLRATKQSQATTTQTLARITETQEQITETQDRIIKTQDQPTETLARMTENLDDMAQSQARVETEVKSNTVRLLRVENSLRGDGNVFGYEIRKFLDGSYPLIAVVGRPALPPLSYRRALLNITVVDEVKA